MPDHLHMFWVGLRRDSDQRLAARFFRKHFNGVLCVRGAVLQKQGHDNVLREEDRERDAVVRLVYYIAENPVRAGLVDEAGGWPFSGSCAVGYPDLDWRMDDFPERFWKIYALEVGKSS
jgi:REP element-mobilizing transposase RayT